MSIPQGTLGVLLWVISFYSSSLVGAFPASRVSVVQRLDSVPAGWSKQDVSSMTKTASMIKLRIQLSQPRINDFYELATKIATPGDELYGQHLSREAADSFLAPAPESVQLVQQWLESEGLGGSLEMGKTADNIIVHASVAKVEKLLRTEYHSYSEQSSGRAVMRTLQYSLPDVLRDHIDVIQPTTYFGLTSTGPTLSQAEAGKLPFGACAASSPSCLSRLYNYANASAYSQGLMGIGGFIGQFAGKPDLSVFMQKYATQKNANESFECVSINGGACPPDGDGVEANLDTQYVRAITQKVPNVYYSTGGSPPMIGNSSVNEPYLEFLNYLLALPDAHLPNTISISYGEDEQTVPFDYATKCCDLFCKLGARGVSILISSGDEGVGGQCPRKRFIASFPASCPWVTAVGGTTGVGPERVWSGSGGGFSDYFARPKYQSDTINNWLAHDSTHEQQLAYFNASGRAYPDIAALATGFPVIVRKIVRSVGGTSASAPVVAGLVQLLSSDRLTRGKKPMGFLNPWLYKFGASALTDITTGKNLGCQNIGVTGFQAVKGWDPTTGFGTPDFEKLLAISRGT